MLRAIGINIALAQSGQYCSCDYIELAPYTELFTKISAADNLLKVNQLLLLKCIVSGIFCNKVKIVLWMS